LKKYSSNNVVFLATALLVKSVGCVGRCPCAFLCMALHASEAVSDEVGVHEWCG